MFATVFAVFAFWFLCCVVCLELFLVSMVVVLTSELELFAVTAFAVVQQMPSLGAKVPKLDLCLPENIKKRKLQRLNLPSKHCHLVKKTR